MTDTTSWYLLIEEEMETYGEDMSAVVAHTFECEEDMHYRFDCGYGTSVGMPFTLWTANRVYFPAVYDGLEWCASVPRNPSKEETKHIGG